jgi:predicted DNA-binding transcriptional regulator AlpA
MHELVLEPECRELTRLHPSTRQRLEKLGHFPKSFKIGDPNAINGRKAWARSEILAWLKDRMAARGQWRPALPVSKSKCVSQARRHATPYSQDKRRTRRRRRTHFTGGNPKRTET